MTIDDAPDLGDISALLVPHYQAMGIKLCRYGAKRRLLPGGQFAAQVLLSQLVALLQQAMPGVIATEVDLHRRGPAIRADDQVAIHRA